MDVSKYDIDENDGPVDIKTYADMPSDQIALALSNLAGDGKNDELGKLVDTYHASWSKNAVISACLIAAAEKQKKLNNPELQTILDKHGDITVSNLKISLQSLNHTKAYEALRTHRDSALLRELRNQAVFNTYSTIKPTETSIYDMNPKKHINDPIEKLVKYLIYVPEAAPHFLQNKNVQKALAQNPSLIAKMMQEGNENLRTSVDRLTSSLKAPTTVNITPPKIESKPVEKQTELLVKIEKETQKESAQTNKTRKTIIIAAKQKIWPTAPPPAPPTETLSSSLPKSVPSPQELQSLFDLEQERYEPLAFSKPFEDFKKALEQRVDRPFSEAVMKYVSKNYETKGFYKSTEYSDYLKQFIVKESPKETAKTTAEVKTSTTPEAPIVKRPSR